MGTEATTRIALLLDSEEKVKRSLTIQTIKVWKHTEINAPYAYHHWWLEPPLDDWFGRGKADSRLLKITEPDGSVWYASPCHPQYVYTRGDDLERTRKKALQKLNDAEKAALGWADD